jgi:DNA-binding NtrC family response regulator
MYSSDIFRYEPYFGFSPVMERVKEYINIAAVEECTALISGETGSGKGVVARWIHEHSPRRDMGFVDINCSGLKGELLKTEIFGHCRGAFTGAVNDRSGLIEEADGGTLFLDEIGDMDIDVQCQLLKSIEEKTYRRVGENKLRSSDFRLICATNRDLPKAVKNGFFREDLYYRINTLSIELPPLRARKEDIAGLLKYMLINMGYDRFPFSETLVDTLMRHPWPGNIRELRNVVERALMFAQGEILTIEHFPDIENVPSDSAAPDKTGAKAKQAGLRKEIVWNLNKVERELIQQALWYFGGDKVKASKALGISLASLYRKLNQICKGKTDNAVAPSVSYSNST